MKSKAIIPLAIGLVVGVFAIKYTMDTVKKAQGSVKPVTMVKAVIARQDIPATVSITEEMVMAKETPKTPLLPADAFSKTEDLIGRVAFKSIPAGSPILPTMIAPEGTMPGLMVRVKEGYRAVAVRIDESSGVGYLVSPNDWVDVFSVMEVNKNGTKETESQVILERVQVGAVGQVLGKSSEEGGGGGGHAKTITLLVKTEDVPRLHLAQTRGRITLAMRGSEDTKVTRHDKPQTGPTGFSAVFSQWLEAMTPKQQTPTFAQSATTPQKTSEPVSVLVINTGESAETVTYRDPDSMKKVDPNDQSNQSPIYPRSKKADWPKKDKPEEDDENDNSGASEVNKE